MGRTIDNDVLKEEVMTVRPVLLLVLACGAGLTGSIMRPADAAAFACPETVTTDAPKNAPPLSGLFSGANDPTAGNRLSELMADLRKSGMNLLSSSTIWWAPIARLSQTTAASRTSRRPTGSGGSRGR